MEDGHFNLAFEESVPQGGGTSDFNELINRPKYNGALMTGNTNIPAVPTKTSDLTNDSDFVNQQALDTLEQELQSEIAAEATARGNEDQTLQNNITTLSNAVSGHDTDIQNLENDVDALQTDVENLEGEVNGIEDVIPAQATVSNQLADKAFVNSTVQTGTANFRGNWANWAAVPTDPTEYPADYTGTTTPSTNDYMVVQDASGYVDPTEVLSGTWRFKYTGVWATDGRNGWQPEYQVNETPLTAAQLAALNSGATTALIEQITRNEDAISALDADKQDLLESGENIKTLNNTSLLGSGNITTNKVVEIGNGQYTYQDYVLPTISATIARQVYTDDQAGISQVLHWAIYGTDNNLKVVSSDHIGTEYSIDVLVHNKYHCAYTWTDQTTGDINPTVETAQHITIAQTTGQSTEEVMSQKAVTDALASAGGVKVLTIADYNWPESNPTSVALWLLDKGIYCNESGVRVRGGSASVFTSAPAIFLVGEHSDSSTMPIYAFGISNRDACQFVTNYTTGATVFTNSMFTTITNNLTSTSTSNALSANQGKVLKGLIDALVISGTGAPTTSTVGTVGQLYEDTTNGKLYQCTAVSGSTYTWEEVGGGGGGGPTVVQTTGTSTTDVMSQDATTKLVYPETNQKGIEIRLLADSAVPAGRSSQYGIGIGTNSSVTMGVEAVGIGRNYTILGDTSVAIGGNTTVNSGAHRGVAIGFAANVAANVRGAVAIGTSSKATQQGEVNIGLPGAPATIKSNYGYDGTEYRLLTGVHDGINAHDAATYGQIQALEARIAALEAQLGNA